MPGDDNDVETLRAALVQARHEHAAALARIESLVDKQRHDRLEAQHHLRNFLSVIRTITRRSADDAGDVENYCALLDGRLSTYMHVHAAIAGDLRIGTDLASLLADELLRFGVHESERIRLCGPAIRLGSAAAGLMALLFHEWVSDLVLSGRADDDGSELSVDWYAVTEEGAEALVIAWVETVPPGREHPGSPSAWAGWLEQAIDHQLGGTIVQGGSASRWSRECRLPAGSYKPLAPVADNAAPPPNT